MDISRADSHHPNLRLGKARSQPLACPQFIFVDLVRARNNVDGNELALVFSFQVRADIVIVDGVTTPGELFFTVAAYRRGHEDPPVPAVRASYPIVRALALVDPYRAYPKCK